MIEVPVTVGREEIAAALSPAQRRFARRHRAAIGPDAYGRDGLVIFYREGVMLTRRWVVDRACHVVQYDAFARAT